MCDEISLEWLWYFDYSTYMWGEWCSLTRVRSVRRERIQIIVVKFMEGELKPSAGRAGYCILHQVLVFCRPRHMMSSVQAIVREASLVPVHLPNINALKEALAKARDWSSKVDHVQVLVCL